MAGTSNKVEVGFSNTKNILTAVDSSTSELGTIFFPTDSRSIILDGKKYGVNGAYCDTPGGTSAKTASYTDYKIRSHNYFLLTLVNANSSVSQLTLNVNGTGAKTLYINGNVSSANNYTLPAGVYPCYYNGSNYYVRTDSYIQGNLAGTASYATNASKIGGYTLSNLPVGGRNLWINSSVLQNGWSTTSKSTDNFISIFNGKILYTNREFSEGEIITLQAKSNYPWATAHGGPDKTVGYWLYYCSSLENAKKCSYTHASFIAGDGSTGIFKKTIIYEYADAPYLVFRFNTYSKGTSYTYKLWDVKLELGVIATDWTPAPEDKLSVINIGDSSYNCCNNTITLPAYPSALKNPKSLEIQLNDGTIEDKNLFTYDGSSKKEINITPSNIGAATSGHNHDSSYLKLSGGTMSGPITLTSGASAAYNKTALSFTSSDNKTEQARIGTDKNGGLGIYGYGTIYLRPGCTDLANNNSSGKGLAIGTNSLQYNGSNVSLSGHTHSYLPLSGGTMTGKITAHNKNGIAFPLQTSGGTRASYFTDSNSHIHGGEDAASYDGTNIQIGTWYGFGIYPTISGQTRTQGKNSFWHNARTGNTYTVGNYYQVSFDSSNNLVYTPVSVNGHTHTFASITNKIVAGNEFNFIPSGYGTDSSQYVWINYLPYDNRNKRAKITSYLFGDGSTGYSSVKASTFYKSDGTEVSYNGHTHAISLASDSGTSNITLSHGSKYKLTAGGKSIIFTTPSNNAHTIDNWLLDNIVTTGYITSSTANLSSYWAKVWDVTLGGYQYNDITLTLLVSANYAPSYHGIITVGLRQNGKINSHAYDIGASLKEVVGNIPSSAFRLYYDNSTGYCQLWGNTGGQYATINTSILKKCYRIEKDTANIGVLYSTDFTATQTLPDSSYVSLSYQTTYTGVLKTTGQLNIVPNSSSYSYNEGIRINTASNGWTSIMLKGTDNNSDSGTSANSWSIHTNNGNFYINKNGSNTQKATRIWGHSNGWSVGNTSVASYALNVGGTTYTSKLLAANTQNSITVGANGNDDSYLNSLSHQLIVTGTSSNGTIRFGTTSWDWNQWAGLKYTYSNKTIDFGIADGTVFTANNVQTDGSLNLVNIKNLHTQADFNITGATKITSSAGLEITNVISGESYATSEGYYTSAHNNIILRGDATYGKSGILFTSSKGTTSINQQSDKGFIQFQPYGGTSTSGESNKLVIGVGNDADDMVYLQTPSLTGLRHAVGTSTYVIPANGNNTDGILARSGNLQYAYTPSHPAATSTNKTAYSAYQVLKVRAKSTWDASNSKSVSSGYEYALSNYIDNAGNADTLDGYHAIDVNQSWYTLCGGASTTNVANWYKLSSITSTKGDNIDNDWMIEIYSYGDQNYTSHIHGYLRCTSYSTVSTSIVLSTDPFATSNNFNLYATIDSSRNVWLGVQAAFTCKTCFRILQKSSVNPVVTSGWTTQTTTPNTKYITRNGSLKNYNGTVQKLNLNNVNVDYATNANYANSTYSSTTCTGNAATSTASSSLKLLSSTRQSSLNYNTSNSSYLGKVTYSLATSTAKTGKPPVDGGVLTMAWDNKGWASQIAVTSDNNPRIYTRGATSDSSGNSSWDASWNTVAYTTDIPTTLKNPNSLIVQVNGNEVANYNGSSKVTLNVTPSSIGAANSSHTHSYLPLSGGTITNSEFAPFTITRSGSSNASAVKFSNSNGTLGYIGMTGAANGQLKRWNTNTSLSYDILDSSSTYVSSTGIIKINGVNPISKLQEGTSNVTDGTMFITSYASDNGFADTNAVNTPYKRKASCLYNYIKGKTDTQYVTEVNTSGDYLTYKKNGTTVNLDIPNADKLDGKHWSDIKIGARNYYKHSSGCTISIGTGTKDKSIHGYSATPTSSGITRISNLGFNGVVSDWTVSCYLKASVELTANINLCDVTASTAYNEASSVKLTTEYVKHTFTFLNVAQYNTSASYNGFLDIETSTTTATIYVKDIKIERGTIATDWSLAPEDAAIGLAIDTGTASITLAHGSTYKLSAGGTSVIFKMPTDNNTTYNFNGTIFYSGNKDNSEHNANSATKNGHYYYSSNGPATSIGASTADGALYVQAYNDSWVGQIAQDYRTGRLFFRGKNNGTWQSWLTNIDSGNYTDYAATKDHTHTFNSLNDKPTSLAGYGITDGVNTVTTSGSGNAITGASVSGHTLTLSKGTFLTSHQDISGKLDKSGGTMTGVLNMLANQYTDARNGALNMNNSDIYDLNSIYTADKSDSQAEGIHFWRSDTTVDTFRMADGKMLFTPNRTLGSTNNEYTVLHSGNYTSYTSTNTALTKEDLNAIKTPGFYNAGGGNTCISKPTNVAHFGLLVIHNASGEYYTQILTTDTTAYKRQCVNGTWGNWSELKFTDTHCGYCDTASATAAKVVYYPNYVERTGNIFILTLANANTYTGQITLNVNGTGAKNVVLNGGTMSSNLYSIPAGNYLVYYDGTNYHINNDNTAPIKVTNAYSASKVTGTLSWNGYASGSYDGSVTKTITIPSNTNQLTNGAGFTTNKGTVTSVTIKMNDASKGTITSSGTIDLGTVITSHQDISGKSNTNHTHSVKINGISKTVAASGGAAVNLGNYLTWYGNADTSTMNGVARLGQSTGMVNLSATGNNSNNPYNGSSESTSWHLYFNTCYSDGGNGSNSWVAQIANKAGTNYWWVRSRSGGKVTDGSIWTSSWRHLVTSDVAGVGGTTTPVYVDSSGNVTKCSYTISKSVPSNAVFTDTTYKIIITNSSTGTSNVTSQISNGNVRLNYIENNTLKTSLLMKGAGGTTVTANYGVITINSAPTTSINTDASGNLTIAATKSILLQMSGNVTITGFTSTPTAGEEYKLHIVNQSATSRTLTINRSLTGTGLTSITSVKYNNTNMTANKSLTISGYGARQLSFMILGSFVFIKDYI